MPVGLGSFDVIIGMDWLSKYHAIIVCDKKLVCIPLILNAQAVEMKEENAKEESLCGMDKEFKTRPD
ncbi:reverse transcriptase domain-containing protein [Tanacetum coccineum]|uniref:Reverse transcriptase domain-containing protein n=1 Tax=Tanacetum coccineum TaxID=301880 RepID=A0ABQ5FNK8_9ASTR